MGNVHRIICEKGYLEDQWVDYSKYTDGKLSFIKLALMNDAPADVDPLVKLFTIIIHNDGQLNVFAIGQKANVEDIGLPAVVTEKNVKNICEKMCNITLCEGLNEGCFTEYLQKRKGAIFNKRGHKTAYLDTSIVGQASNSSIGNFPVNGTVRSAQCHMVVMPDSQNSICKKCKDYRKSLSVMAKHVPSECMRISMVNIITVMHVIEVQLN